MEAIGIILMITVILMVYMIISEQKDQKRLLEKHQKHASDQAEYIKRLESDVKKLSEFIFKHHNN